jgi:hypothetical protein
MGVSAYKGAEEEDIVPCLLADVDAAWDADDILERMGFRSLCRRARATGKSTQA